jgi:hypothetical protein
VSTVSSSGTSVSSGTSRIRRRALAAANGFDPSIHPVLRRVYAARGIAGDADLDQSLPALLPVSTLAGRGARRASCSRRTAMAAVCW